ncbi:MAG: N-acetylmuramic acid 6-phosphate etherase [Candidatus Brocadiia bacterium]|jgi:N-acetylmuramic acid 6-phosphate etherase
MKTLKDRARLTTEKRNVRSREIDRRSTLEIVAIINREDMQVAPAVARERKRIAAAADLIVKSFQRGGRLFYVGAGTSGRLGVLDASECPPTYGTRPFMVQGIIAGGARSLRRAVEGAEDDAEAGARALDRRRLKPRDVVAGISACGLAPFVRGAMERARQIGAATIFVTCAPEARKLLRADVVINPVPGPEVLAGSTRMKAGTATKLVLNTLTTTAMIRCGKAYGNLMVDVRAGSEKLRDRAERIVMAVTGVARPRARRLLKKARGRAKVAIVMQARKIGFDAAVKLLKQAGGSLRSALENQPR